MHVAAVTALLAVAPSLGAPQITFWYGEEQIFGHLGRPQAQINILGNVQMNGDIAELTFALDGGPELPINWGPDARRLASPGDFNIELFLDELSPGVHDLLVRAVDENDDELSNSMRFLLLPEQVWPLPYDTNWFTSNDVTVAAQPVDGRWIRVPGGVRCPVVGYDRLLAVGDMQWTDYDVTVPIRIHGIQTGGTTGTPGIGIVLRWNGHTDFFKPGSQPSLGYWPLGAAGEFVYHPDQCGPRLQLYGNPFVLRDQDDGCTTTLEFDVTYIWKIRVRTLANGTFDYRFKVWEQGTPEPTTWLLSMIEESSQPAHGSLLLLAHYVDATFGDVVVTNIERHYPAAVPEIIALPVGDMNAEGGD